MSYILEALKKSQQERELGHVPTLETPSFLPEEGAERPGFWVLSAVVLAALAIAIALYSALRGSPPTPEGVETAVQQAPSAARAQESPTAAAKPLAAPVVARSGSDLFEPQGEAIAPPMPKAADTTTPDTSVLMQAPAAAAVPQPEPPLVEAPPVEALPAAPKPPAARVSPQGTPVPQDLLADIEAFKHEVRKTQSIENPRSKKKAAVEPRDLRLPKDVRERMPDIVMSAHIYDKEPAKRFVLINGLKVREGEESREEVAVEEILPDGAVLSFDGNRFFQRR